MKKKHLSEWTIEGIRTEFASTSLILLDVHVWMQAEKIDHHFESFQKHKFNGEALAVLKQTQGPLQLIPICEKLGIVEVGEALRIAAAIHRLQ